MEKLKKEIERIVINGERENQKQEFKREVTGKNELLKDVSAMANSGGGRIYIGIEEKDGRAVLAKGVEDPEKERVRIRDWIADGIEPRLNPELKHEMVGNNLGVIVIDIKKRNNELYMVSNEGRYYERLFDSVRIMKAGDIKRIYAGPGAGSEDKKRKIERTVESRIKEFKNGLDKPYLYAMSILPNTNLLAKTKEISNIFNEIDRRDFAGFNCRPYTDNPTRDPENKYYVFGDMSFRRTVIHSSGIIEFSVPIKDGFRADRFLLNEKFKCSLLIDTFVLCAYISAFLDTAAKIYKYFEPQNNVYFETCLLGIKGFSAIPQYVSQNRDNDYWLVFHQVKCIERDSVISQLQEEEFGRFENNSDNLAYRVVIDILKQFLDNYTEQELEQNLPFFKDVENEKLFIGRNVRKRLFE